MKNLFTPSLGHPDSAPQWSPASQPSSIS